jgi:3-oxoacyl-[acyl-carrier protein] reductase
MNEENATPVVAIVGAAGGIGSILCQRVTARGGRVIALGRTEESLRQLGSWVSATRVTDARDFGAVEQTMQAIATDYGRLDAVVNLAGSIVLKPAHSTSAQEWDDVIAINLRTAFAVVRAAAPLIGKSGGGSIILMSSAAARHGLMNHDAIAAAKAGVIGLAQSAAATYASRNVRVNAIAPGLVRTPLAARITNHEASLKASEAMHPLGRIGEPAQVASMIDWLLQTEQQWITGQVFGIDGGLSTARSK